MSCHRSRHRACHTEGSSHEAYHSSSYTGLVPRLVTGIITASLSHDACQYVLIHRAHHRAFTLGLSYGACLGSQYPRLVTGLVTKSAILLVTLCLLLGACLIGLVPGLFMCLHIQQPSTRDSHMRHITGLNIWARNIVI